MAPSPPTLTALLARTRNRLRWRRFGRALRLSTLIGSAVYAALLLLGRALGLFPALLPPLTMLTVPGVAVAVALAWWRRPGEAQAARHLDRSAATHDLFLTAVHLTDPDGGYAPGVVQSAAQHARTCDPGAAVPLHPGRGATHAGGALLAVGLLGLLVPSADPFGLHAEEAQRKQRRQRLTEQTERAQRRLEALKRSDVERDHSPAVKKQLERTREALNRAHELPPEKRKKALARERRALEQQWRQLQQRQLQRALNQGQSGPRFGRSGNKRAQWKKQMAQGEDEALQKELSRLKEKAKQLENAGSEEKARKIRREMKRRLQNASDFARNQPGGGNLQKSIERAREQLHASAQKGMREPAAKALQNSLDLAQKESAALAQDMRDLRELRSAMKKTQQGERGGQGGGAKAPTTRPARSKQGRKGRARTQPGRTGRTSRTRPTRGQNQGQRMARTRRGNGQQPGQAGGAAPGKSQAQGQGQDSARSAQGQGQGQGQRMARGQQGRGRGAGRPQGAGEGQGSGGPGRGRGGAPGAAPSEEAFEKKVSPTRQRPGRTLMSYQTDGKVEAGRSEAELERAVQSVRQRASSAILEQRIPRPYHDAVRRYFDDVEQTLSGEGERREKTEKKAQERAEPAPAPP
jgi:hypothetical protein